MSVRCERGNGGDSNPRLRSHGGTERAEREGQKRIRGDVDVAQRGFWVDARTSRFSGAPWEIPARQSALRGEPEAIPWVAFWAGPVHGVPGMFRFYIFGFPVTVEPMFWISCFLLAGGLHMQAWSSVSSIAGMGIWTILAFFSILAHELGHAAMARRYGCTPEIILHACGGAAIPHGARFDRRQDLLVVGAGPAVSFAMAGVAWALLTWLPIGQTEVQITLGMLWVMNLSWAIFNLLPILPLDGGQLLRTALGDRRLRLTATIGLVCAVGVAILGLLIHAVFMTLFMALFAYENWRLRQSTR